MLGERFAGWVSGREDLFTVVSGPAFALTVLRVNAPIPASTAAVGTKSVTETRDEPGTADEVIGKEVEEDVGKRGNEVTREVYERINAGGKVMLTSTVVGERYVIRIVSGNPQTDLEHLRKAFNVLVATAEEVRVKMLEGANGHVSG